MNTDKTSIDYHLASLHLSKVREVLGGVQSDESSMAANALSALLQAGLTEDEIISRYKEMYPNPTKLYMNPSTNWFEAVMG